MSFHPKTSGAAVGSALGVLIVAVLGSIHGVHLTPAANGAIPGFLGIVGAWFAPSSSAPASVVAAPAAPAAVPPAPKADATV